MANKVQTLDGKWLAIDGRPLHKAVVSASETYNTALERHLVDALGVRFAERPNEDARKRPVREIVGVDPELNRRFSKRRINVEDRRKVLAAAFQATHGRPPTPVETIQLSQQATLETREAKHEPRSLAEQREAWNREAVEVLGTPQRVKQMVARRTQPEGRSPARWPTRPGSPRPPTASWRRWRAAGAPGSTGTSTPRPSARSGPPTCPPTRSPRSSTCWSARSSTAAR